MSAFEGDWQRAAGGLRLVAYGAMVELVRVAFTLPAMLALGAGEDVNGMAGIAMLNALGALVAQSMLVVGIFKFSQQPSPRPSAGLGQAAGALGMLGIAIGLCVFVSFFHVSSALPISDEGAMALAMWIADSMSRLGVLAVVVGFFTMVLFLAALGSVASHVKRVELARRARTAIAVVLVAAVVYAFVELGITPRSGKGLAAALVVTTIVQIAALGAVLGNVRWLSDVLRFEAPPPELRGARA